jgi:hypothetical protein
MDELNSRDLQSINRVVTQALAEVKLNRLWLYLHDEYGIGRKSTNLLHLTGKDHQRIRAITQNNTRLDPILPLPGGDRLTVAKNTGNEKLGSDNPGRHHILLNSPCGFLSVNGLKIPLTSGSSYRCDWRQLDLNTVRKVIVVENLQAFDYIQMASLPATLNDAWVLYRGHDVSAKATLDLLNALSDNCQIIGFADYDPAGFKILLTTLRLSHCLLPKLSADLFKKALGTQHRFQAQQTAINYVEKTKLSKTLQLHWQALMQHRVCVAQELMLSTSVLLECCRLE